MVERRLQQLAILCLLCEPPRLALDDVLVDAANEHIYHQYTIRAQRRDQLAEHLKAQGIGHKIYYPLALHQQPCFADLGYQTGSLPVTEQATAEVVSLPIYPELTEAQQGAVIAAIRGFYAA